MSVKKRWRATELVEKSMNPILSNNDDVVHPVAAELGWSNLFSNSKKNILTKREWIVFSVSWRTYQSTSYVIVRGKWYGMTLRFASIKRIGGLHYIFNWGWITICAWCMASKTAMKFWQETCEAQIHASHLFDGINLHLLELISDAFSVTSTYKLIVEYYGMVLMWFIYYDLWR